MSRVTDNILYYWNLYLLVGVTSYISIVLILGIRVFGVHWSLFGIAFGLRAESGFDSILCFDLCTIIECIYLLKTYELINENCKNKLFMKKVMKTIQVAG